MTRKFYDDSAAAQFDAPLPTFPDPIELEHSGSRSMTEKQASDAPVWYSAEAASGWASGYNAAVDAMSRSSAGSIGNYSPKPLEIIQTAADEVVSRVVEWDDRTSPDDFAEALLITPSELHRELVRFAEDIGAISIYSPDRSSK